MTSPADSCGAFEPDFFNNVAAIAVVLMFTNVVSHRGRKAPHALKGTRWLAVLHVAAVVSAMFAVIVALFATAQRNPNSAEGFEIAAWSGLGVASVILIGDIVIDELFNARPWRHPRAGPNEAPLLTSGERRTSGEAMQ